MSHFLMFIHMIIGTLFFGSILLSCYLVHQSRHPAISPQHRKRNLTFALFIDGLFALLIITGFITGTLLATMHQLVLTTPWIVTAYGLLSLVACSLYICARIKWANLKRMKANQAAAYHFHKTYLLLNGVTILLLILMIHDAITKSTFLWN